MHYYVQDQGKCRMFQNLGETERIQELMMEDGRIAEWTASVVLGELEKADAHLLCTAHFWTSQSSI